MSLKQISLLFGLVLISYFSDAQTSTDFWFAPPEVTSGHVIDHPMLIRLATSDQPAVVTIEMPANPGFNGGSPIVINMAANSSHSEDMTAYINEIETAPMDQVLNTGIHISSTANITAYYEVNTNYNPEIFALKGLTGLGTQFYTPFQDELPNGGYTPTPYTSFDIVATEDNTEIIIYPRVDLEGGHNALETFVIILNAGQTYSGGVLANNDPNPTGTAIASNKPISVSVKDDSVAMPAGCRDLVGDQLVPVSIVGKEYIVSKGYLNTPDKLVITATENYTTLTIGGVQEAILFAGQSYEYVINDDLTFVQTNKPVYAFHITGFGCEIGGALLPPLNCAGSEQVSFTRSSTNFFALNILTRSGNEGNFEVNGDATLIQASDFVTVPGTNGEWMGAQISFDLSEIQVDQAYLITNSSDVFAMGLINGGATSGCRFGYFSEFAAEVFVDAGENATVCANTDYQLSGIISGGATTGMWSTSGSGSFIPNTNDLNATYVASPQDILNGSVEINLISTSQCEPVEDFFTLTFEPAPIVNAGEDLTACSNNPAINVSGSFQNCGGITWGGGNGTFSSPTDLNPRYTPTQDEINSGSVTLTLTSTANGGCNAVTDEVVLSFTPSPTADAGENIEVCSNNAELQLNGSVTLAGGGIWSGGQGVFIPSASTLNALYLPSDAEINAGSMTLTLTTTDNGNCLEATDDVFITFTASPTVDAGPDQIVCSNNADVQLAGSVTVSSGGQWSGGLGVFTPSANALNAVYTPTQGELLLGTVTLKLSTTGNGNCELVSDVMTINFTPAPTVNAGLNAEVCATAPSIDLNGSTTVATGGVWSAGGTNFAPNNNDLNTTYTPTDDEINAGETWIVLTSTNNGNCAAVSDSLLLTIKPIAEVNAGNDIEVCANNSIVDLDGIISNAGGGQWSGGTGTYSPSSAFLDAQYAPSSSEIDAGVVTLTLSSTNNGLCPIQTDQVQINIFPAPTVNAGTDETICLNNSTINLEGQVQNASTFYWSGGNGVFSPSPQQLDATYSPTDAEKLAGAITLTLTASSDENGCSVETDEVTYTFTPSPNVSAGTDVSVCANDAEVNLEGFVSVATGGTWSGGNGIFTPSPTVLNAIYTPTQEEISTGILNLTLSSTGNGNCSIVTDEMTISISAAPSVDAGEDQMICVTQGQVALNGTINGNGSGIWSTSGTGIFSPSNNQLDATYILSSQDSLNGSITLTLTSTLASCAPVSDSLIVSIQPAGTAQANEDLTVCGNNAEVNLTGSVGGNAIAGFWSTNGDGVFGSPDEFNTTYTPGPNDITNGTVTTTFNAYSCNQAQDDVIITINPTPVVIAGEDITTCSDNLIVPILGLINGSTTTGIWSTNGSGTFSPSNTDLNATYNASLADAALGEVQITLETTNADLCNPVSDNLTIFIQPEITVDAGEDLSLCSNNIDIQLNGQTSLEDIETLWTTSGTGTFLPNASSLTGTYIPSEADVITGNVSLTLAAVNSCNNASDNLEINFIQAPSVNAGNNQTLCSSTTTVNLAGAISGITNAGLWSTSGSGFFTDNTDLTTEYTLSDEDLAAGQVTLTLSSVNNLNCLPVTDEITITISNGVEANAGVDQQVCIDATSVQLQGEIYNGSSTGTWTSNGTGTFNNPDLLDAQYTFSPEDLASGNVQLTLTSTNNGECAGDSDVMVITFGQSVFANAGEDITICESTEEVLVNGFVSGGSISGVWSTSGTGTFIDSTLSTTYYSPSQEDSQNGTIEIFFTSINNGSCQAGMDTLLLEIMSNPTISTGQDQLICGDIQEIEVTATITEAQNVIWSSTGSGIFTDSLNLLSTTYLPSLSDSLSGSFELIAMTTDATACNNVSDTVTIEFGANFTISAGENISICDNLDQITLAGTSDGQDLSYVWITNGTGEIDNADTLNTIYLLGENEPTTLEFTLTAEGTQGCPAVSDSFTATFTTPGTIDAGEDQLLCASISSFPIEATLDNVQDMQWTTSGSGTFVQATSATTIYTPSQTDLNLGNVDLYAMSLSTGCGNVGDTITITFDTTVDAEFTSSSACIGTPIGFTNESVVYSGNVSNITWDFAGEGTSNDESPAWVFDSLGLHEVTLTVQMEDGCENSASHQVEVVDNPIAKFDYSGTLLIDEEITFVDQTAGSTSSFWEFGIGGATSDEASTTYTFSSEGEYQITLISSNVQGCSDTTSQQISIGQYGILPPKTPTGFSPNGDGENDVFMVRGGPFKELEFTIYNDWGNLIFQSTDPTIGWDGTFKAKDQPVGIYAYTIHAITLDGEEYRKSGKVTLIR